MSWRILRGRPCRIRVSGIGRETGWRIGMPLLTLAHQTVRGYMCRSGYSTNQRSRIYSSGIFLGLYGKEEF